MDTFQNRLKQILREKKISQIELSKKTGIGRNSISDYINGKYEAKQDKVYAIAKALDISESWLMGYDVEKTRKKSISFPTQEEVVSFPAIKIPVISKISAGSPLYAEENIIEYAYVPEYLKKNRSGNLFYLKVTGDSMDKEFKENDLVLVEKDSPVENGQIGVILINGYNATVKRIKFDRDKIILIPESNNSEHLPQVYTHDDKVKIVGRVISVQKFY